MAKNKSKGPPLAQWPPKRPVISKFDPNHPIFWGKNQLTEYPNVYVEPENIKNKSPLQIPSVVRFFFVNNGLIPPDNLCPPELFLTQIFAYRNVTSGYWGGPTNISGSKWYFSYEWSGQLHFLLDTVEFQGHTVIPSVDILTGRVNFAPHNRIGLYNFIDPLAWTELGPRDANNTPTFIQHSSVGASQIIPPPATLLGSGTLDEAYPVWENTEATFGWESSRYTVFYGVRCIAYIPGPGPSPVGGQLTTSGWVSVPPVELYTAPLGIIRR